MNVKKYHVLKEQHDLFHCNALQLVIRAVRNHNTTLGSKQCLIKNILKQALSSKHLQWRRGQRAGMFNCNKLELLELFFCNLVIDNFH